MNRIKKKKKQKERRNEREKRQKTEREREREGGGGEGERERGREREGRGMTNKCVWVFVGGHTSLILTKILTYIIKSNIESQSSCISPTFFNEI